ncbi:ST1B1-like protein [Mya arenaria]|uniref:ST1B1-like protein n=1 Tax=Mya arenaria TaxID=6604 RepID=A0ABY7DWH4_MYAAR|nr:ST1B1-like protein [Mya arenaria]
MLLETKCQDHTTRCALSAQQYSAFNFEYFRTELSHIANTSMTFFTVKPSTCPGCTWTYEIMTMLLQGRAEGPSYSKMHVMLEASAPENLEGLTSPRFLNSHLSYSRIPADIRQKRVKVVFVARNPKDAAVSLYNMMSGMKHYSYSGSFANWLPLYMRGGLAYQAYPKYLLGWEEVYKSKQHEMIVLYYEDLKKDMAKEIRSLAQFLDLPENEKLVEEIAEKCQFHEMKTRFDAKMLGTSSYKSGTNYGFMRKGEVGNWKHWFTVAQNEMFDKYIHEQLHGSMYNFTYQISDVAFKD